MGWQTQHCQRWKGSLVTVECNDGTAKKGNLPTLSQNFYRDRRPSILEVPAKYLPPVEELQPQSRDLPGVVSAQLVRAHQTNSNCEFCVGKCIQGPT